MSKRRNLHDLTHSPQAIYQFNNPNDWYADTSGNNKDLTESGAGRIQQGWVGVGRSLYNIDASNSDSPYWDNIGAISVYTLISINGMSLNPTYVARVTGASSRDYWGLAIGAHWNQTLRYLHHDSGGTQRNLDLGGLYIPRQEWIWIGFTRNSAGTGVKLFINGDKVHSDTLAAAPGDHTSGVLTIADGTNARFTPQSLKVVGSELSEVQMKAEYDLCFSI